MTIVSISVKHVRKPDSKLRKISHVPRWLASMIDKGNVQVFNEKKYNHT